MRIDGAIDDKGFLPGWMKFAGEAEILNKFMVPGVEKSSISLFMIIPVEFDRQNAPNLLRILGEII